MSAPELSPVRHPIDVRSLTSYLHSLTPESKGTTLGVNVPDFLKYKKLDIQQFKFGQSNPTYLLTDVDTGRQFVLRKKPLPNAKLACIQVCTCSRERVFHVEKHWAFEP